MNRKFATALAALSLSSVALAGVKVTSVDLKKNGPQGAISVSLDGRSNDLPDLKVYGKTIEISISQSDSFNAISKNVSGAYLSANALNGKAIVKATLPYEISADAVNLNWKNNNIEVTFPRGVATTAAVVAPKVEKIEKKVAAPETGVSPKEATPVKTQDATQKVENKVSKDHLNEDYLNNLMKENTAAAAADAPKTETKDEVKVQQAALAKTETPVETIAPTRPNDNFSFAGYALKFGVFLAMVLGLFYGAVQLLKKGVFKRGKLSFLNNSQMIEVLSTTYVSPKRSLMIVKAHKQIFLVANSESGLEFLSEMKDTSGLIKEGEKLVTGSNFDTNLGVAESSENEPVFKLKEDIMKSTPVTEEKGLAKIAVAKDIVKFSDELKKKAKKLKPIEFN